MFYKILAGIAVCIGLACGHELGIKNELEDDIHCFLIAELSEVPSLIPDSLILDHFPTKSSRALYSMETNLTDVSVSGISRYKVIGIYSSIQSGYIQLIWEYQPTSPVQTKGQYQAKGEVLSTIPFEGHGNMESNVSFRSWRTFPFEIVNGHISLKDGYGTQIDNELAITLLEPGLIENGEIPYDDVTDSIQAAAKNSVLQYVDTLANTIYTSQFDYLKKLFQEVAVADMTGHAPCSPVTGPSTVGPSTVASSTAWPSPPTTTAIPDPTTSNPPCNEEPRTVTKTITWSSSNETDFTITTQTTTSTSWALCASRNKSNARLSEN